MADIKWIKLDTEFYHNRKINQIRKLPEGSDICLLWVFLMCLAGSINDYGQVYFTKEIPYTEETLATEFDLPISTVRLGLQIFEKFGMIEIVDNFLHLSNWERYQNIDGMEKIREQTRQRVAKYRERKLLESSEERNVTVTLRNAIEKNRKEEEKNRLEEDREVTPYQAVVDLYHEVCISFPSIRSLSDARRKAIKARCNTYTLDDFREMFEKAEASDFLKGKNNRNWQANFDWLMNGNNFAKVLDGNYDNKTGKAQSGASERMDEYYDMVQKWANER